MAIWGNCMLMIMITRMRFKELKSERGKETDESGLKIENVEISQC